MKEDISIVIYDGQCNLCDRSVKLILKYEAEDVLFFSHLHSKAGQKIKNGFNISDDFDGILLYEKGKLYGKSEAVLHISTYMKFPFSLISFFFWIPLFIRDGIYDFIANRRYRWFGKDECLIPDEKIRKRFIE